MYRVAFPLPSLVTPITKGIAKLGGAAINNVEFPLTPSGPLINKVPVAKTSGAPRIANVVLVSTANGIAYDPALKSLFSLLSISVVIISESFGVIASAMVFFSTSAFSILNASAKSPVKL